MAAPGCDRGARAGEKVGGGTDGGGAVGAKGRLKFLSAPLVAHCHLGLGRLYHQTGRAEQARAELSTAIEMYRAMDMTFWLPQAEAALAQVEGRP